MTVAVTTPPASEAAVNGALVLKPGPLLGGVKVITPPGPTGSPPKLLICTASGSPKTAPTGVPWLSPPAIASVSPCASYAPISVTPLTGRGRLRMSVIGAPLFVPVSIEGEGSSSR